MTSELEPIPRRVIVAITAEVFGVHVDVIVGPSKLRHVIDARFASILLIKEFRPTSSLFAIAGVLGDRDHTSILGGLKKTPGRAAADPKYAAKIQSARERCFAWRPGAPQTVVLAPRATLPAPEPKTPPTVIVGGPSDDPSDVIEMRRQISAGTTRMRKLIGDRRWA